MLAVVKLALFFEVKGSYPQGSAHAMARTTDARLWPVPSPRVVEVVTMHKNAGMQRGLPGFLD